MSFSRLKTVATFKPLLSSYCQSSRASNVLLRSGTLGGKPLGTWINRLKRWQSGSKTNSSTNKKHDSTSEPVGSETSSSGDVSSSPNESEKLLIEKEELLKQKDVEINDIKDKYLRSLAEIENTRQRMTRQIEDSRLFGIQGFSRDILDVADVLEKAIESVPETELRKDVNPQLFSLFEGLKMTDTQLQNVFQKNGLVRINPVGEAFDPAFHEALFEIPGENPGTVGVVSKVGYILNGRTIRPAVVGVIKAIEPTEDT